MKRYAVWFCLGMTALAGTAGRSAAAPPEAPAASQETVTMVRPAPRGQPLRPGDEQPILVLYHQLKDSPDPVLQRTLKGLGWSIDHLGADIPNTPAAHEKRMAEACRLADGILVGTARAHVEQVFTQRDGGLSGPYASRYYMGDEVMVEVPYDETGGRWKPTNRVTGPVKVYKSTFHAD